MVYRLWVRPAERLCTSSECVGLREDVMVRGTSFLCGLALLVLLFEGAAPANAQQRACFAETGHCIGGRFAQYWQQNGGLPVFGYPLTDELSEQGRTVQYFERQRFELHSENAPPYDVLLGLL